METKKTESQIEEFVKGVESLRGDMLNEGKGYMLLAYEELENEAQKNNFSFGGKLNCIAECLYSCMKKNEILANIIVAAANALVQSRMLEAQAKEAKGKKSKKIN